MAIDRRSLLKLSAAAGAALAAPRVQAAEEPLFLSSVMAGSGAFQAEVIGDDGMRRFAVDLSGRGHDAAIEARQGLAVVFARRPGTFAVVLDLRRKLVRHVIASSQSRHFFGHGVFSEDGARLYATENDFVGARGVLGIYDVQGGFERVGEIPTAGIGPHEVIMAPDKRSLIVANGGIDTDPASGRDILNPDSMRPSLSWVDLGSGTVTERVELDAAYRQLSIRHLSLDAGNNCWFGCQWEGDRLETPPLVGRLSSRDKIDLFDLPKDLQHATRNYVGAMAASRNSDLIAASCPKGGLIMLWDAAKGSFLRMVDLADGCGVAEHDAGILATSGEGGIALLERDTDHHLPKADVKFDNHLRRFALA